MTYRERNANWKGGVVSHEEARTLAQAYIDHAFGNKPGADRVRHSIPAREDYDSDLRLTAYIDQQQELADKLTALEELDRWREPAVELPELIEGPCIDVEFRMVPRDRNYLGTRHGTFHTGHFWFEGRSFAPSEILCWRPAREVGELPVKEASGG